MLFRSFCDGGGAHGAGLGDGFDDHLGGHFRRDGGDTAVPSGLFGDGDWLRLKAVSVDERQRFLGDQPNERDDNRRNDPQRVVFNDGDGD